MEGGEEGCATGGVERAMQEEVLAGFWLAAAGAHESIGVEMRIVGAEIASAGAQPCEDGRLAIDR